MTKCVPIFHSYGNIWPFHSITILFRRIPNTIPNWYRSIYGGTPNSFWQTRKYQIPSVLFVNKCFVRSLNSNSAFTCRCLSSNKMLCERQIRQLNMVHFSFWLIFMIVLFLLNTWQLPFRSHSSEFRFFITSFRPCMGHIWSAIKNNQIQQIVLHYGQFEWIKTLVVINWAWISSFNF